MRAEYQTKPQAKLCYDFTVCGISVKGSAMVDTFKKAHDQCARLNKRYGPESHWVEPADKIGNTYAPAGAMTPSR